MTRLATVLLALLGFLLPAAGAEEPGNTATTPAAAVPVPGGWAMMIAPYVWATGLAGEVGGDGTIVEVDESFGDVIADLDFGFLAVAEIRHGRFGVFSDLVYGKLSSTEASPLPALVGNVGVTSATVMWTAAAEYRLIEAPEGHLDGLAGMRLFSLTNQVRYRGGSLDGLGGEETVTWADPIVGIKGEAAVTGRLYLTGWAMLGGFGVASDTVWDIMGGAGYRFNETASSVLGYRAAGVDHETDAFVYDTVLEGLFASIALRY